MAEEEAVIRRRGKWSQAGVPHKGWCCVEIEDLGKPELQCEMCESQSVRYVHYMEHKDYESVLAVGCVCAGHMEEDLVGARSREASMKGRSDKRKRWLTRVWRVSAKGNHWLKADNFRVTVYQRAGQWGATVASANNSFVYHMRRSFPARDQAKLAAFDYVSVLLLNK